MRKFYGNSGNFVLFNEPIEKIMKILYLPIKAVNSVYRIAQTEENKFEVQTTGYFHLAKWNKLNKTEQLMKDLIEIGFIDGEEDIRITNVYPTNSGTWMHTVIELSFWDSNYRKHSLEKDGALERVFI